MTTTLGWLVLRQLDALRPGPGEHDRGAVVAAPKTVLRPIAYGSVVRASVTSPVPVIGLFELVDVAVVQEHDVVAAPT